MTTPEDFEQAIPAQGRTFEAALRLERLRTHLTQLRSAIGHVERKMSQETLTMEQIEAAISAAEKAEEWAFKMRFELGYP